jgi:hypothetical protein
MQSEVRVWIYGVLAIVGVLVTWYFNLQFMAQTGSFDVSIFVSEIYVNAASSSIGNDLAVAVLAFLVWLFAECRRLEMPYPWVYALLTFGVAFAFALPFFLFMRERRIALLDGARA